MNCEVVRLVLSSWWHPQTTTSELRDSQFSGPVTSPACFVSGGLGLFVSVRDMAVLWRKGKAFHTTMRKAT